MTTHHGSHSNQKQVGGDHYQRGPGKMQHWDMVNEFGLDYFQGQITKYLFRFTRKRNIQDLEKAQHYLNKYIEINRNINHRVEGTKVGDFEPGQPGVS